MLRSASSFAGRTIPVIVLLATVFLLTHPYTGIRHDAVLYTAQAIYNANPAHFRYDLFFQFGSQDQWTLYGKLYGKLIEWIGIGDGNRVGLVISEILWWTGAWRMSKRLLPTPWRWIALLFVAGMPRDYGDGFVFSYNEGFLSARLPAEAIALWAISFALDRRSTKEVIFAFLIALFAMTLHPLIGAVGMAAVLFCVAHRAPWGRIAFGLLVLFALSQWCTPAWFAIHPFDAAWQTAIRSDVSFLFPSEWDLISWNKASWVIALPLFLAGSKSEGRRIFWRGLALIGASGVSFAYVADVAGHDAMWIQLQLWRVLWLLTAMQWIACMALIRREWRDRPALLWALAICWMVLEVGGGCAALCLALLAQTRCFDLSRQPMLFIRHQLPRYPLYLAILTIPAALFLLLSQHAFSTMRAAYSELALRVNSSWMEMAVHSRLMALVLACLCLTYLVRDKRANAVFYVLLLGLLAYAVVNWDQRSPTDKIAESLFDTPQKAPFVGRVVPGQMVYWDGPPEELVYPWFLMKTASYFSEKQGSGIVFHRQTTFEALHRAAVVRQDDPQLAAKHPRSARDLLHRDLGEFVPLTQNGIVRVCHEPHLDFVVSSVRYTDIASNASWSATPQHVLWLYDCKKIDAMTGNVATRAPD